MLAKIAFKAFAVLFDNFPALTNEPYVTGGNPVIAGDRQGVGAKVLFNDILGISQGAADGEKYSAIKRDSFGEVLDNSVDTDYDYFTGKPMVEGLGYAFLFRSYQPGLGKWTTSDPSGYPDGWNNFAYGNNKVTSGIDWLGAGWVLVDTTDTRKYIEYDFGSPVAMMGYWLDTDITKFYSYTYTDTGTAETPGVSRIEIDYYSCVISEYRTLTYYSRNEHTGGPDKVIDVEYITIIPYAGGGATVTRRYVWE